MIFVALGELKSLIVSSDGCLVEYCRKFYHDLEFHIKFIVFLYIFDMWGEYDLVLYGMGRIGFALINLLNYQIRP